MQIYTSGRVAGNHDAAAANTPRSRLHGHAPQRRERLDDGSLFTIRITPVRFIAIRFTALRFVAFRLRANPDRRPVPPVPPDRPDLMSTPPSRRRRAAPSSSAATPSPVLPIRAGADRPATAAAPATAASAAASASPTAAAQRLASTATESATPAATPDGGRPARRHTGAGRPRNGTDTRDNILRAAVQVFAKYGLEGGRIEQISRMAKSNDRMIYYYFKSKENLFNEALRHTYRKMNEAELALDLDARDPVRAITGIIHFVWNYYLKNPLLITLLNNENLHRGRHIRKDEAVRTLSTPALDVLQRVIEEGERQQVFRPGLQARQLYLTIASLGYFYLSNAYTLSAFLDVDLLDRQEKENWLQWITQVVLRSVLK